MLRRVTCFERNLQQSVVKVGGSDRLDTGLLAKPALGILSPESGMPYPYRAIVAP